MIKDEDIKIVDKAIHELVYKMINSKFLNDYSDKTKKMSMLDFRVLRVVSENPGKQIKDLLNILQVPNSTLTSVINRLEKRGIVKRVISPEDRRSFNLEITDEGKVIQEEHMKFDYEIAKKYLEATENDQEKEFLIKFLRRLAKSL
ncbi:MULTISPECIES: MarR family winged helix-turn-helix transcriptional regulator [Clostridium]|uniref:Multidrug resistance operon repressor n=3 Tax=Clostridium TaxID=1485 RepID=D8GKK1_CLOLD|nr:MULTISPECIES: MarR family transcriptional regulator [Clostridium]ADK15341.1 predicted transcriptional regulator [Clostridium ljungdahlii DSM 13528]AGY74576.1 MarR family transcriptional regulator [Clostridium autoethanogenum DSM 10061]ALU34760.1 Transcriptional regulator MarR family [Clostridium autoethanogenum DSM 10061]OAA88441.1 Multidrug resistance operon repressor [Clostridium ljungdahlii DSM 13528]OAA91142.1 Multidrug resistance operon repressor [Clostridium coskatii]